MTTAETFNHQGKDQSYKGLAREVDASNRAFFDTYFVRPPLREWIFVNSMHERLVEKNLRTSDAFSQLGAHAEAMQTAYAAAMTPKVSSMLTDRALEKYKQTYQDLHKADSAEAQRLLEMNRAGVMVYADGRSQAGMDAISADTLFKKFVSETADLVPVSSVKPRLKAKPLSMENFG